MNERIHAKTVRLIDVDGQQTGVVSVREALQLAEERGLDLVEVAPNSVPPVCKIMDFGKYKYQLSKKHNVGKKIEVKEVKLRPQIFDHDLELKARNIRRFLDEGNKAKVTMFFRGREMVRSVFEGVALHCRWMLEGVRNGGFDDVDEFFRAAASSASRRRMVASRTFNRAS